jgi:tellurium resistance protein TerD
MTGINLVKGQSINLSKEVPNSGLNKLRASIGWDNNKFNTGGKFDLDISIFGLEAYPQDPEHPYKLVNVTDFCFYNMKEYNNGTFTCCNGSLTYSGDNRTGEGEGDDEFINIDLSKVRPDIINLSIVVSISNPNNEGTTFGQVANSYVKLTNMESNEVVCNYDLGEDFSTETAVQFASIYRYNGEWKFKAFGLGYSAGIDAFIEEYNFVA